MMYEDWPTLQEVHERTGISDRTLHRKINDGTLRKANRNLPGRKPVVVIDPQDAAALEATTLKPIPVSNGTLPATRQNGKMPDSDILPLLAKLTEALEKKLFLSLKEAARYSGLPQSYLQRRIKEGTLSAKKIGGWRIRRNDLETMTL
jgi:excisionase family DNA binding protein